MASYSIIPIQGFPKEKGNTLDLKAIAFYMSTGFFLEDDSYYKDIHWNELDFDTQPWKYEPRDISLDQAVDEFASLYHDILKDQLGNHKPILPLSGGLDSRSLAVAMGVLGINPHTYSYRFEDSFAETSYGKAIASKYGWEFEDLTIPPSYLWKDIEEIASTNQCYAEFTHARQAAVAESLAQKGDIWLLGHWGDVLFDDMGVDDDLPLENQLKILQKKVLKKGGVELASDLWKQWSLEGSFDEQLSRRIRKMAESIPLDNANARVRAFKSMYWATRWTSTNLTYFSKYKPIALPYYDDRMCKFIMSVPEKHLAGRQIQIEYIKKYAPEVAAIPWQDKHPFNLYNFHHYKTKKHLPYRVRKKIQRTFREKVLGKNLVLRNWEIQFLSQEDDAHLRRWLFENPEFNKHVPIDLVETYYKRFRDEDRVYWSHPVSMLLTLSLYFHINKDS